MPMIMVKKNIKKQLVNLTPLLGLIVLFGSFIFLGLSNDINLPYAMKAIFNQSVVVATVATGAIFIYTLGSFDISLGASLSVSALIGGMAYNATGSLGVMFLTCILVAVLVALTNSVLASLFNLPVFVTTIAMLSMLNALVLLLININGQGSQIVVPTEAVRGFDNFTFKLIILAVFIVLTVFLFNYTKIGKMQKFIGGNLICSKLSGVPYKKMAIIAFVISGIGVGLGAILTIIYAPTLTRNTGASIGMEVIIAIVFGGMPISGGARSKITAAVIGAFSMTLMNQIMTMLNVNLGTGQMIRSVIFILVVYLATSHQKKVMLPR